MKGVAITPKIIPRFFFVSFLRGGVKERGGTICTNSSENYLRKTLFVGVGGFGGGFPSLE